MCILQHYLRVIVPVFPSFNYQVCNTLFCWNAFWLWLSLAHYVVSATCCAAFRDSLITPSVPFCVINCLSEWHHEIFCTLVQSIYKLKKALLLRLCFRTLVCISSFHLTHYVCFTPLHPHTPFNSPTPTVGGVPHSLKNSAVSQQTFGNYQTIEPSYWKKVLVFHSNQPYGFMDVLLQLSIATVDFL